MFVSLCSTRRATPTASCCRKQKQSSLHQQHSVQSPVTIHKLPNKKKKNLAKAILLAFVLGWWLWMLLTGSSPVFGGHLIQTSNDSDHPLPWLIVRHIQQICQSDPRHCFHDELSAFVVAYILTSSFMLLLILRPIVVTICWDGRCCFRRDD